MSDSTSDAPSPTSLAPACGCGDTCTDAAAEHSAGRMGFARPVLTLFGVVVGLVLLVVVVGEWLGLFEQLTDRVPYPIGLALVLVGGFPIFRNVIRAAWDRRITSHTLMTVGVTAALVVGQWPVAAVVVLFMHVANYAERFTTDRARQAVRELAALAPTTARIERDGAEVEIPVEQVRVGEVGDRAPRRADPGRRHRDRRHRHGRPGGHHRRIDAGRRRAGRRCLRRHHRPPRGAAHQGQQVGADTTFGRVITMVEEAETHRAPVQRIADRFAAYYLPVVITVAALPSCFSRDVLATAAVLVVACSCSFAMATPVAVLASIGAAAGQGLLIKGGRYLEALAKADVLLIDKTGTLTLGRPQITDILPLDGRSDTRGAAAGGDCRTLLRTPTGRSGPHRRHRARCSARPNPADFRAIPGHGVQATVDGDHRRGRGAATRSGCRPRSAACADLVDAGKTLLAVTVDGTARSACWPPPTPRDRNPCRLGRIAPPGLRPHRAAHRRSHATAAALVAGRSGIAYRASLLPEDKIAIVPDYQNRGHRVVMVGDGVNDAPALAQADVGIAMGAAGSDIAIEAAHIALMRDDWTLVPHAIRIARRTARVIRINIGFTAGYNAIGLTLAALGILPMMLAAAAQSLPDLGILANSTRLLRAPHHAMPKPPA